MNKLKKIIKNKDLIIGIESHSPLTTIIIENTINKNNSFDFIWYSSLTNSTIQGEKDDESYSFNDRISSIKKIKKYSKKPIIFDGDSPGFIKTLKYRIKKLEEIGVSAIVIEDKKGYKLNSLSENSQIQEQENIEDFSKKIKISKETSKDIMIISRIESFILGKNLDDAKTRAMKYIEAGSDAIIIHSKSDSIDEITEFCNWYSSYDKKVPLFLIPTTYFKVSSIELKKLGANGVIYANHLLRAAYKSMQFVANSILENGSTLQIEKDITDIKEFLKII